MKELLYTDVENLQSEGKKLLIDFSASWCSPCRTLSPILESFEDEYQDITFVKVDIDNNKEAARKLGIRSVPTVVIYNGESLIKSFTGVQKETTYKEILDTLK